jgi:ADP-ribose pyrophosphatase YjhB (NUDIX family)
MVLAIPAGDERRRAVCGACGTVTYANPRVVVACVVRTDDNRILLAKRAIAPRLGYWGMPQGFLEHGETTREAAIREVREETGALLTSAAQLTLQAVYQVPGSVQLVYQAKVAAATLQDQLATTTLESSAIQLFSPEEIPYEELCFPTVQWALEHCLTSTSNEKQPPGARPRVQQRTKLYDAALDQWSDFEDEGPTL